MHLPKAPEQLLASGYTDSSVSLIWNHPQHDAVETKQQIIGKYIKLCVIRKLWILLPVKNINIEATKYLNTNCGNINIFFLGNMIKWTGFCEFYYMHNMLKLERY